MNCGRQIDIKNGESRWKSVDFRRLEAFQRVYQERNYASAGQRIFATRKSIIRMMQNLEKSFGCTLFTEGTRGELEASAFAERLYNDLRFLNSAKHRMRDHITAIREQGRILHVGSSPLVFRTREFRSLFREIQSLDGIRICYSPVESVDPGKVLVSGNCDLYIGSWSGPASRFTSAVAGMVTFRTYRRLGSGSSGTIAGIENYVVSLDGREPTHPALAAGRRPWRTLADSNWLQWLDHPAECPDAAVILAPDAEVDARHWEVLEGSPGDVAGLPLHASFLRQHPYEFLPALVHRIQQQTHT